MWSFLLLVLLVSFFLVCLFGLLVVVFCKFGCFLSLFVVVICWVIWC